MRNITKEIYLLALVLLLFLAYVHVAAEASEICTQLNLYKGECEDSKPVAAVVPLAFPTEEISVAKGEVVKIVVNGGVLPLRWNPDEGIEIIEDNGGREIRLKAAHDFCSSILTVEDSCGMSDTLAIEAEGGCCSDSTPLEWDYENSVETIPTSSSGNVVVVGGQISRIWAVEGSGCWLDQGFTQRQIENSSNSVTLYTDENSCGSCQVTTSDGCSSITGNIRVTSGKWVEIDAATCPVLGAQADAYIGNNTQLVRLFYYYAYEGKYRIRQDFYTTGKVGSYASAGYRECSFTCNKLTEKYPDVDTYSECKDLALSQRANEPGHPLMIDIDSVAAVTPIEVLKTQLKGNIPDEEVIVDGESWGAEKICYSTHPTRTCSTSASIFTVTRAYKFGPRSAPAPRVWEWVCNEQ